MHRVFIYAFLHITDTHIPVIFLLIRLQSRWDIIINAVQTIDWIGRPCHYLFTILKNELELNLR